jgi:hypothetical protein
MQANLIGRISSNRSPPTSVDALESCTYRRNWLCLFILLDVSLVNSHILMQLARDEVFLEAIDAGCNPTVAPFRQVCSAASFRRLLAKELIGTKVPKKQRARRTYVKKTDRFVFHARTKGLEWARAKEAARSSAGGSHKLVTMVKKRRCIVCRFEFKRASVAGKLQS